MIEAKPDNLIAMGCRPRSVRMQPTTTKCVWFSWSNRTAVKASSSISESGPMARLKRPNISSRHVRSLPDHARQSRIKTSSRHVTRLPNLVKQSRANLRSRHVKRLPDYAREGRTHRGEKALRGRVPPTPQSVEFMVFGAGAAALLSGTNRPC